MPKKYITNIFIAISFAGMLLVSFQNCSAPTSFQEPEMFESSSFSDFRNMIVINGGDTYTRNSQVNLQIEIGNAPEMYVTNDPNCAVGGQWQQSTRQMNWNLGDKNTMSAVHVKFRSTYLKETDCFSDSIIHDDIPPVVSLAQMLPAKTNAPGTEVKLSITDSGSGVDRLVCPADVSPCQNTATLSNTTDGIRSLTYSAYDKAGNQSQNFIVSYLVDRTPPVLTIRKKPASPTASTTADFEFSADDQYSTNNTFKCQINGAAETNCPYNLSIKDLSAGNHRISVVALDDLGNRSEAQTHQWTISRNLPLVNITKSPATYTNVKGSFEFTGQDQFGRPLARFECQLNNSAWAVCASPYDLASANLNTGANNFKLRGIDADGLISGVEERNWNFDTTAPALTFATKPALFSKNRSESVKVNVIESQALQTIEFTVDGAVVSNSLADTVTLNDLAEKAHNISVVAVDKAGNRSAALTYLFYSDFTKPTLSFPNSSFPALPTPTKQTSLSLNVAVADNYTMVENTLTSRYDLTFIESSTPLPDNYVNFAHPQLNITNIKHGIHQLKLIALDRAGNQSDVYLSDRILVDLIPPAITYLQLPLESVRPNSTQRISYSVLDVDSGLQTVKCKLVVNNVTIFDQDCQANVADYSLAVPSEGTYVFTITATDKVGHTYAKSVSFISKELYEQRSSTFSISSLSNNKVDILFIRDNSTSMKEENARVADNFNSFITNLGDIDYRIAVMTTDVGVQNSQGSLLPIGDESKSNTVRYIDRNTPNALAMLQQTLTTRSTGSGEEAALAAVKRFFERIFDPAYPTSFEKSFYRSDAVLATVSITDDDEAAFSSGFRTATDYLNYLNTRVPNKTYIHHSNIVLPNDQSCLNAQGQNYGVTYFDTSRLTGGISTSICALNYGDQLRDFATRIITKVAEQTLPCIPIDYNQDGTLDISVSYINSDNSRTPVSDFTVVGNKVRFSSPLESLGQYVIDYYCVK